MRISKSLILFVGCLIAVTSCFEPPEFSDIPRISFSSIYYRAGVTEDDSDTIRLTINFRDGDGNLGLSGDQEDQVPPFHDQYLYVDFDGELYPALETTIASANLGGIKLFEIVDDKIEGMKVTRKSSYNKGINGMKKYRADSACVNYVIKTIWVTAEDKDLFDEDETFEEKKDNVTNITYFGRKDTFYIQRNPMMHNIDVSFWVSEQDPDYDFIQTDDGFYRREIDGSNLPECIETFSGRFPRIERDSKTPMEGTISYAMKDREFESTYGNAIMRIKVKIRDRAGNVSNEIRTPSFTLKQIERR